MHKLLKHIQNRGEKALDTIHHDPKEIHCVLERIKGGGYHWWEVLLGLFPPATGVLNLTLHPVIVLIIMFVFVPVYSNSIWMPVEIIPEYPEANWAFYI